MDGDGDVQEGGEEGRRKRVRQRRKGVIRELGVEGKNNQQEHLT